MATIDNIQLRLTPIFSEQLAARNDHIAPTPSGPKVVRQVRVDCQFTVAMSPRDTPMVLTAALVAYDNGVLPEAPLHVFTFPTDTLNLPAARVTTTHTFSLSHEIARTTLDEDPGAEIRTTQTHVWVPSAPVQPPQSPIDGPPNIPPVLPPNLSLANVPDLNITSHGTIKEHIITIIEDREDEVRLQLILHTDPLQVFYSSPLTVPGRRGSIITASPGLP